MLHRISNAVPSLVLTASSLTISATLVLALLPSCSAVSANRYRASAGSVALPGSSAPAAMVGDASTSRPAPQDEPQTRRAHPSDKSDKSGTNPLNLQDSFILFNEYQSLPSGNFRNIESARYVKAFHDGTMNFRTTVPFVATDAGAPGDETGLGDLNFRYNWIPKITHQYGLLVGAELNADTATDERLGRGKWTFVPTITTAFFLPNGMIFAPSYQHNFSFAGQDDRPDIHEGYIDLYVVATSHDRHKWLLFDPTIVLDYENDASYATIELELGHILGPAFGGAGSFYIRPGIGIGNDRPYDWNLEVGFKLIGF